MRIRWILSAGSVAQDAAGISSPIASYRYRAAIPMAALRARGHACSWHGLRSGEAVDDDHASLNDADVLVFGKNHSEQAEVLALIERARARGLATIADVCDDYFEAGNPLEPYYRAFTDSVDLVTTSSAQLAQAIDEATGTGPRLVRDPYEGPAGTPRWAPDARALKALWFGTPLNLEPLLGEAVALPQRMKDYTLDVTVLTRECQGLAEGLRALSQRSGGKLELHFEEWSLERNWAELRRCDLALIPVKQGARFAMAKGPNRVVEALRAGRVAAVNPLPAYEEFRPWALIGGISEGIEWALGHPAEVVERIAGAQAHIERHYSPAAVAAEWEAASSEALRVARGSAS